MMHRTLRGWLLIVSVVLGCLFVGSVGTVTALELLSRDPGLQILAQDDAGQVAMRDGRLLIYTKVNRTRNCRSETSHWLFTVVEHGDETVRLWVPLAGDAPVPVTELGITSSILSVPLPPGLWPAKWFWLAHRTDYCGFTGWLFPRRAESDPLPLDIERARPSPNVPVTAEQRDGKTIVRSRSPLAPPVKP